MTADELGEFKEVVINEVLINRAKKRNKLIQSFKCYSNGREIPCLFTKKEK
jgi:hypothetical protein